MAHGVPVAVGQRAFEILLLLVSRHGELATKDELMTAVWPGIVVEENNIQVHVSALRKVLAKAGDAGRYLVTIPGRGYRFVAPVECDSANQPNRPTTAVPGQAATVAAAGSPAARNNLPHPLTSLIGREAEVAEIKCIS